MMRLAYLVSRFPTLAATFGERARDMAQIYHPDRVAEQALAVYEAVAGEGGRR
ncbi:MAG: hypothetical protein WBD05_00025 [Phycisphaerae bacterium]